MTSGLSIPLLASLVITVVVNALSWTALVTDQWGDTDCVTHAPSYGLWRWCMEDDSDCESLLDAHEDMGSFAALQTMSTVGHVGVVAALVAVVAVFVVSKLGVNPAIVKKVAVVLALVGAVGWLLAILIFVGEWPGDMGYSFALGVLSSAGAAVVAAVLIVEVVKAPSSVSNADSSISTRDPPAATSS